MNFAAGQVFFSGEMRDVFDPNTFPYYSGAAAQVLIKRYFIVQSICAAIALLHLVAEWLYLGRPLKSFKLGLLLGLFAVALIGGVWLQPKLRTLHRSMYFAGSTEQREM